MDVALIVVGDEILNGSVGDENIAFLGATLASRGHRLARASVVGDEPAQIAAEVRALITAAAPLVIVSGGLGPTHDDRTIEGVAEALGVGLSVCEPLAANIGSWVARAEAEGVGADTLGAAWLHKMALVPDGATLLECSRPGIPAFHVAVGDTDIAILPGPPWMFRLVFEEAVAPRFLPDADAPGFAEIEHGFPESALAALLDDLARAHDAVAIGSYPQGGRVLVRVRGRADVVEVVATRLREHLEEFSATPEGARLLGRAPSRARARVSAPASARVSAPAEHAAPPRWVRACVWAFLTVFVVCALGRIEAWPFTGWQLFSHARAEVQHGWTATIETQGVEIPLANALPGSEYLSGRGAYRGLTQTLQRFERYAPARRSAVCLAWHARAAEADRDGPMIRIYQTETHVGDRIGARGAPPVRTVRFTCDPRGVVEVFA